MLSRLGNWIREFSEDEAAAPASDTEWAQTLAGLLVEAAMVDAGAQTADAEGCARVQAVMAASISACRATRSALLP